MDYKIILGYLAVLVGFMGYVPYLRNIFKNKTKPHLFSWFLWGLIEAIIFVIQVSEKAGPGAWGTGVTAVICLFIAALSVKKGVKKFHPTDWVLLTGALLSILLWWYTKNPLGSVILLIVIDGFAFSITFRKTFYDPASETVVSYVFSALKSAVAIFALQTYNLNTWLFFTYLVAANSAFVIMALIRRRQMNK